MPLSKNYKCHLFSLFTRSRQCSHLRFSRKLFGIVGLSSSLEARRLSKSCEDQRKSFHRRPKPGQVGVAIIKRGAWLVWGAKSGENCGCGRSNLPAESPRAFHLSRMRSNVVIQETDFRRCGALVEVPLWVVPNSTHCTEELMVVVWSQLDQDDPWSPENWRTSLNIKEDRLSLCA